MSGSNKGQGQGAVGNIQRLSKLGRRRAGTEDKPPSSDQALIASIFLPSNEGGVPEAQAPGPTDETAGFEALSDLNPPPHEESGPSPVRTVEKTPAPGASEPVPEEPDKTRRPSRKAVIAAVVILVLTAAAFMRSCGDATDKKPVATKPADVPAPWVRLESNEVKPLNTILPGPEAAVGVDREKQIPRMLENLNKPEKPSIPTVGPAAPAAKAEPENTERTHELDAKVASLTQELNALKAQKAERPQVKKAAARATAPVIKILAVARTEKCLSCPLLALLDVDGKTLQVASGDKIKDYTVAVSTDRVVLSRGKENLTFYTIMAP